MGGMKLRPATLADIELLKHWDTQPHVIAASGGGDEWWDWDRELANPPVGLEGFIAEHDGRPIGFLQITDLATEETRYWGPPAPGIQALDIWIGEEADLNKGYGTQMMRLAIERCFADPAIHTILIDPLVSNTDAHRFYERLGFKRIEQRFFDTDECYVYRLTRDEWMSATG